MAKFTLSAFADEISLNLQEEMDVLEQCGIHYIEMRNVGNRCVIDYSDEEIAEIKKQLDDRGFKISAIGSPIGKIPIDERFEPHLDKFKRTMEIAHMLGTPYIRMFSFFIPRGHDPYLYKDKVMERWFAFVDAARNEGLVLLHENEKEIYGDIPERCLDILRAMNVPFVRATFDPANFVQCDVETYPHAFELLKEHIVYMHIKDALYKDHRVVPSGQGDGKVREILRSLNDMGYEGFLSIEPHLDNSLPGGGPDKFKVAYRALMDILNSLNAEIA